MSFTTCEAPSMKRRGGSATTRINRRALLLHSGAAVASTVATATCVTQRSRRDLAPTSKLRALIEAHLTAYAAIGSAIREKGGGSRNYDQVSREEERALLAICAYPAVSRRDRLAKAEYLLEIEARGELDLPEHMQALLRSTISNA